MLKLHYEILDFYKFIQLTDTEIKLRNKTFNEIKDIIELNFPNYKCSLYGSFITGLSLPNSDIDILITRKDEEKEKINLQKNLLEIYTILKQKNIFTDLEMINAKVPIITGLYISTKIHVDISLFKKNGVDAAEIINKIIAIYPEIRPLMLLIKYVIRQRNLNQIYTGGISSFIIFTLLYYYIADSRKIIESEISNNNGEKERLLTLGHLLVGFFNFYAFEFRYEKFGISISNGCHLYKREDEAKYILSVKNFEDESQDMGVNCFNYSKILDVFKLAAERLNYAEKNVVSYLKEFIFPDETLKERAKMKQEKQEEIKI
jgi:non-canonical poly(A) RNA polymerase PAPD5/7